MASLQSTTITGSVGASTTVADASTNNVRNVIQNAQGGGYTLVASDNGKHILAGSTVTVPNNVFAAGNTVAIYNNTGGGITVSQGGGFTLRQVGTGNTGNRTLAQRGLATVLFLSASEAVITGGGLT
jgi:hypothetical protein